MEGCPLWIVFDNDAMPYEQIERKLGYGRSWFTLPAGVERDEVIDSVVEELRKTAQRLSDKISPEDWDEYAGTQTARAQSSAKD